MKEKLAMIFAAAAAAVLVVSVPATPWWGPQVGAILRWIGLGLGAVYMILRIHIKKEQE